MNKTLRALPEGSLAALEFIYQDRPVQAEVVQTFICFNRGARRRRHAALYKIGEFLPKFRRAFDEGLFADQWAMNKCGSLRKPCCKGPNAVPLLLPVMIVLL